MPMHEYQKQMYKKIGVVAALIILPIAGFFAGTLYQKQMTPEADTANGPKQLMGGPRMMKNRTIGTVKSISETSITITSRMDDTDKTYSLSSNTTYKDGESSAKFSDIKAGDTVALELDESDTTKVLSVTLNPPTMFHGPQSGSTDMMMVE